MDIDTQETKVPEWYYAPCIMGIDEAGRGPVVGPMVYACVFCPQDIENDLKKRGFADSKVLKMEDRDRLFEEISNDPKMGWKCDVVSAKEISGKMLQKVPVSLNTIAVQSTFKIIERALKDGVNLKQVFVDTLGNPKSHELRLSDKFPNIKFTVCAKADAIYPIVSAASIMAKVTRDQALQKIEAAQKGETNPMGSGYPHDSDTIDWLKSSMDPIFGFDKCVRFSWSTCDRLLKECAVEVKWECDEDNGPNQQKLTSFTQSQGIFEESSGIGRHSFFRSRRLQRMESGF